MGRLVIRRQTLCATYSAMLNGVVSRIDGAATTQYTVQAATLSTTLQRLPFARLIPSGPTGVFAHSRNERAEFPGTHVELVSPAFLATQVSRQYQMDQVADPLMQLIAFNKNFSDHATSAVDDRHHRFGPPQASLRRMALFSPIIAALLVTWIDASLGGDDAPRTNSSDPLVFELSPVDQSLFSGGVPIELPTPASIPAPVNGASVAQPQSQVPSGPLDGVVQPPSPAAAASTEPEPKTSSVPPTETRETTTAADASAAPLTLDDVQSRRAQAEQISDLADDIKVQIAKHYQQAADALKLTAESTRKTAELKAERERGPALIAESRAALSQPLPATDPEVPHGASVADLGQLRLADEERSTEARKNLEAWETRAKVRAERKPQMPALIEKTKQQLADARKSLESPAPEGELPALGLARRTDQEAHVLLLQQQMEQYRAEQVRYEALTELFPLQRDELTRIRNFYDKRLDLWKSVIAEARRVESALQAQQAREKLRSTHRALRDLAEHNAVLTQKRNDLQEYLGSISADLTALNTTLNDLKRDFESIAEKETRAGLTTGVGMLLRNQRNHLPSPARYREQQRMAEREIVRFQLEQMPLEDDRDDLGDIQARAEEILVEIAQFRYPAGNDIRSMTVDLLEDRKKYLDDLLADYDTCLKILGEIDVSSRNLIETIREYENYIDERVLWIRSAGVVDAATARRVLAGSQDVFSVRNGLVVTRRLLNDINERSLLYGLAAVAAVVLLTLSRKSRSLIRKLGQRTNQHSSVSVPATLGALGLTLLTASVWPVLLWLIGWRLCSGRFDDFTVAIGGALMVTGVVFWSVEVFRQICRAQGIAATFLDWPAAMCRSLHSNLLALMVVGLPLVFLVIVSEELNDGIWADSLGRAAFVTCCLLLTFMLRRILRPGGRVLRDVLRVNHDGWMNRTKNVWYPTALAAPLAFGLLALFGFQYTAEQLLVRLQWTFWLSMVLIIAYTLVMKWMLAARRQLAIEQARARRAAAVAASQQEWSGEAPTSSLPPVEEPRIDLSLLDQQMLQLVRGTACVLFLTGGWLIWSQVLPALQIVNRVELWNTTEHVTETVDIGDGRSEVHEVPRPRPITLGSLLLAIAILGISVLASRNLPGLLELSILQRLPLDHGGRYAVTTLCRYALALTGAVLACRSIGIGWSSVQWLLAALTVGLGFGLQEIFANFVSGLIILFERPIRIGDVVTIDGVTGSVSRIQIRATTITDWDRKEYIVPNKEFVTGRLLNWTLSDKTNRIVLNVGVAYGSNTERALSLLLKVVQEHPLILEEPAPLSTFEGFGDSCLNLVLRCYLPNLDNRLKVITELHAAIDTEFRKAGIEIAFPQRDIHVRTVAPQLAIMPEATARPAARAA